MTDMLRHMLSCEPLGRHRPITAQHAKRAANGTTISHRIASAVDDIATLCVTGAQDQARDAWHPRPMDISSCCPMFAATILGIEGYIILCDSQQSSYADTSDGGCRTARARRARRGGPKDQGVGGSGDVGDGHLRRPLDARRPPVIGDAKLLIVEGVVPKDV